MIGLWLLFIIFSFTLSFFSNIPLLLLQWENISKENQTIWKTLELEKAWWSWQFREGSLTKFSHIDTTKLRKCQKKWKKFWCVGKCDLPLGFHLWAWERSEFYSRTISSLFRKQIIDPHQLKGRIMTDMEEKERHRDDCVLQRKETDKGKHRGRRHGPAHK